MGVHNLTPRELYPLAKELRELVGYERINMMLLGSGGLTMRRALCEAMETYHVRYRQFLLIQDPPYNSNGYRRVIGIKRRVGKGSSSAVSPAEMQIPHSGTALLVDDNVHSGVALAGGVIYCLENREHLGSFEKLYTLVYADDNGYTANFAMRRNTEDLKDFDALFREISPQKHAELERRRLLNYLADEILPAEQPSEYADILSRRPEKRKKRKDDGEDLLKRLMGS